MPRWLPILTLALAACARHDPATLTVSVAASLHPAIDEAAARFTGARIVLNFGGSGALARQILNGAPADLFLAAGPKPMDDLAARGLLLPNTRRDLLRNTVVLIASNRAVTSWQALADPQVSHIALGDPESVPAGDYGRQVLRSLGLWDRVQSKLVLDHDVRQVLAHVESGNADAGIVYATDTRTLVKIPAPPGTHQPVLYPIAVLSATHNPDRARAFATFLAGPEARAIFERHGFTVAP